MSWSCRLRAACAALLLSAALATAAPAKEPPGRVVSLNLCADQFLVLLLPPARIAALSPLATDRTLSAVADRARDIPQVRPSAEAVLPLAPDLAIAGPWGGAGAAAALARRGVPVLRLELAEDFAAIAGQLRRVGEAVGESARAEAIVAEMDHALAILPARAPSPPTALVWQARGFAPGTGTLADAVLRAAGYANAAPFSGYGFVPLERLLADPPALLVTSPRGGPPSLATTLTHHPAIAKSGIARAEVEPAWLACGSPYTVRAASILAMHR
ncbi:ABC transporter substrate-binding protein [Elioraea sp.]|uniref:ABC transporter substrate-binding protein n=1 Tax=Elioraea sp. TaxID=2185103 RepID=UPI0025C0DC49|nr:ABC transporter substrate-binding protein [Elioraea sp.]